MWITVLLAMMIWGGVMIWSAWRAAWLRGAAGGITAIVTLLIVSAAAFGAHPIAYGITLALTLFFGGAMVIMGLIAYGVRMIVRLDGE
ncbi:MULTISPECIES: hypothetical protein [Sphingomonas]|uniref:hypothetical protein n=1 Tax=Sphingomonas TaxID=13687 RepID=UPI00193C2E40|nr:MULTISPECIES: hypothetical protein [Sphingomonas]